MSESDVTYPLNLRIEYLRRATMAGLLFSLAQLALKSEQQGEGWEQVVCYLTGDGDYKATTLVDKNGASE